MDKITTVAAIREESLNLTGTQYKNILFEFDLLSFSERRLNEMNLTRLQEMLGKIRRLIILCGEK